MRRHVAALVLAAALFVCVPVHGQGQGYSFDLFGAYLESLRAQAAIPGMAAAIVGEDRILWERAFGRQDLNRSIATRTDTPFHVNGLTQTLTAALVLRCVEDHHFLLDDHVRDFDPDNPEGDATIWQLLTHTSGTPSKLTFNYKPERLDPLWTVVRSCTDNSYRETLADLLQRLAMIDSIPGPDVIYLTPPAEGVPDPSDVDRYKRALERLATPYSTDAKGRALVSQYSNGTLRPGTGLISTVRDLAQFDLALKAGLLLRDDTLAAAWTAPVGPDDLPLPHGMGWFVQSYSGEKVVWQFGVEENATSSLMVTVPSSKLTFILLANSDRLVRPFPMTAGELQVSPFGRLFLTSFVR